MSDETLNFRNKELYIERDSLFKFHGKSLFKSKPTLLYIILAYGITWMILFPLIPFYDQLNPVIREFWHVLGSFGPAIAGIIVIGKWKGKEGIKDLLKRCLKYSGIMSLIIALIPLLVFLVVFPIDQLTGSFTFNMLIESLKTEYLGYLWLFPFSSLFYGIFEEIGWRGFLLPNLQRRWNALKSSAIITVIWWLWHLPMFFYRYDLVFAFTVMPLLLFSGTLVFTYLFNKSAGSLLMVMLMHITYDLVSAHNTGTSTIVISVCWIILDVIILALYYLNYRRNKILQEQVIFNIGEEDEN